MRENILEILPNVIHLISAQVPDKMMRSTVASAVGTPFLSSINYLFLFVLSVSSVFICFYQFDLLLSFFISEVLITESYEIIA